MPAVSRSYCKRTPARKMGFSQRSSCKAQGLLKRSGKKNKGKYVKSLKYKRRSRKRLRGSRVRKQEISCWKGYSRVPGTKPGTKGSCKKN
jgi:hypothetical protein